MKNKIFLYFILCLCSSIIIECVIFSNEKIKYRNFEEKELPLDTLYSSEYENITYSNENIIINSFDDVSLISDIVLNTRNISINITSEKGIQGKILIKDDGMKEYWQYAKEFYLSPGENITTNIPVKSQGQMKSILINFYDNNTNFSINSIRFNMFNTKINFLRIIMINSLLFIGIIYLKKRNIIWKYNQKKSKKIFIIIGVILLLFSGLLWRTLSVKDSNNIEYKKEYLNKNIYLYMFDSMMKNISYLDIEVDDKLFELQNVYDRSERDENECSYMWDYAYFNGKYYSYYGITPLIVIYIPYYAIFGKLPNDFMVGFILCILNIVVLLYLLHKILTFFSINCNYLLLVFAIFAVTFGSLLFSMQSCANQLYNLNLCTCLFIMLVILFSIISYESIKIKRYVFIVLSAIAIILLLECRPNAIFSAGFFVLPLYIMFLLNKQVELKEKLITISLFFLVIIIGVSLIFIFNCIRFGNPLDCGKNYQLTAYDSSYYKVTFDFQKIVSTIYYYILEAPQFIKSFPYVVLNNIPIDGIGHYYLKDPNIGLIFFPFIWSILFYHLVIASNKRTELKYMILMGLIGCFICAYLDFNLGGAQLRYHTDYIIVLLVICFIIMLKADIIISTKLTSFSMTNVFIIMCIITIIIGTMLVFSNQFNYIKELNPEVYYKLARLFNIS